jgi:hypothetical protein
VYSNEAHITRTPVLCVCSYLIILMPIYCRHKYIIVRFMVLTLVIVNIKFVEFRNECLTIYLGKLSWYCSTSRDLRLLMLLLVISVLKTPVSSGFKNIDGIYMQINFSYFTTLDIGPWQLHSLMNSILYNFMTF